MNASRVKLPERKQKGRERLSVVTFLFDPDTVDELRVSFDLVDEVVRLRRGNVGIEIPNRADQPGGRTYKPRESDARRAIANAVNRGVLRGPALADLDEEGELER